jgi:hypothetical protein
MSRDGEGPWARNGAESCLLSIVSATLAGPGRRFGLSQLKRYVVGRGAAFTFGRSGTWEEGVGELLTVASSCIWRATPCGERRAGEGRQRAREV